MRQRSYTTQGVVLGRKDYSEADRVLVIFTKDYGKISFIAKGVRKPSSRKRGALEIFSLVRFSAARGHGLDTLTEAETVQNYGKIRKDIKKVAVAYFFVETIGKITRDEEKNERLFELLIDYLSDLAVNSSLRELRERFIKDVLVLMGFWRHDQDLVNPDAALENVVEKKMYSVRVGKKII